MEEEKNGNKIPNKNKKPNKTFKKSNTLFIRRKSTNQTNLPKTYEKIIPKQRIIKSREKEVRKDGNTLPIIKKNSFNKKIPKNNIPNPNVRLVNWDNKNLVLPNFNSKRQINNKLKDVNNNINSRLYEKNSINQDENLNNEYIIKFFEEFINIINSITNKNLFISLLNSFNKKYLLNYSINTTLNKITDENFNSCLKYIFVIVSCLLFLSKDETSYKFNNQRLKELLDQFALIALKNVKLKSSPRFKSLINRIKPTKKNLLQNINSIIKLLYNNKNEYATLKNLSNQIITNISKYTPLDLSNIINNSLLYDYNHQMLKINNPNPFTKNKKVVKNKENQKLVEELIPSEPYIKTKMTKKFCMVLDIDETLTHTLKLPFGDYFLVRPGVKEFLQEMKKYFEIIIFTSSPKSYADNILDKIDTNGEFFQYRLYRRHAIYENGDCVKKLSMIGRDLKKIIFVDNLKSNAKYNPDNLYNIKSWYSDIDDGELIKLKDKLKEIVTSGNYDEDITKGLKTI